MMPRFPLAAPHFRRLILSVGMALFALTPASMAQDEPQPDPSVLEARQAETRAAYERLAAEMAASEDRKAALAAEIESLKKDSTAITSALIQSARTEKKLADDVAAIAGRVADLNVQQDSVRQSLRKRRGVLAEVLAALQRMGLNPPPAILVRPEDALGSVRSAILLGAVVPELRAQTEILVADLEELKRVTAAIHRERARLENAVRDQVAERQRLDALLKQKQALREQTEAQIAAETEKAEQLAAKATSLQDLITSLDTEIASVREAREAARKAAAEEQQRTDRLARLREQDQPVPEENRLRTGLPFDAMKNRLLLPVSGQLNHRFGQPSGDGLHAIGDTIQTQSGSIVTALADGIVLFAGAFRSYGKLLILDAGDGYHVVMAGMAQLNVIQGQKVSAGEPVGVMGEKRVAAVAVTGNDIQQPELYVEFRKDKKPVDPAAWWSDKVAGRTRNDS
ncbi:murein hydrolase activator EnvC family protein [Zhengella mangrovi]|nr:murein hydrolase activator EnvC [Zhengella mangrovi]